MAYTRRQTLNFLKVFLIVLLITLGLLDLLSRIFTGTGAFTPEVNAEASTELTSQQRARPSSAIGIVPYRIAIPAISVDTNVEAVGKRPDGTMGLPSSMKTTAWYKDGYKPGEKGNAVIDGHLDNALGTDAVFKHLGDLAAGDSVYVSDSSGRTLRFVVEKSASYDYRDAPTSDIFGSQGRQELLLLTCDGDWNPREKSYEKRLVVFAELAS